MLLHQTPEVHSNLSLPKVMEPPLIGHPQRIEPFKTFLAFIAKAPGAVLITGPTGSGKKRIARFLIENGPLSQAPVFNLNGLHFSETLWDQAYRTLNHRGTLVVEGLQYLPLAIQGRFKDWLTGQGTLGTDGKLLPPEWKVLVIGDHPDDFLNDLLYRFTYHVRLPSLNEVIEDIPYHIKFFLREKPIRYLRYFFLLKAFCHEWRGNLRELEQCLLQAMAYYQSIALMDGFQGGDEVFGEKKTRYYQDITKGEWWYFPFRFPPGFTERLAAVLQQTDFRLRILKEKWVVPLIPEEPGFLVFDLSDPEFEKKANAVFSIFSQYLQQRSP